MSKIVSLTLNNKLGILEAQEVFFNETKDGLIEVKAGVGEGKTTLKQGAELAISAANSTVTNFDVSKFKDVDIEVQLTYGNKPIYMRVYTSKSGKLESVVYLKDGDKKIKDPVINGKKLTPAILRDILKTQLTFGIDDFLSENPRTHMDFMMKVYSHKLKSLGVVFDKSSPLYQGSVLHRLEVAKEDRRQKHYARRAINGFKEALEDEGWKEDNVPTFISIDELNKEKEQRAVKKAEEVKSIQEKIFEAKDELRGWEQNLRVEKDRIEFENEKKTGVISNCNHHLKKLIEYGYDGSEVQDFIDNLPQAVEFEIDRDKELELSVEVQKWENALNDLPELNTSDIDEKIEKAQANNRIIERWNAYFDWHEADKEVKKIWREYQNKFAQLDLGVKGLSIQVVGDEEKSEIRTFYNGEFNPEFFGNPNKEPRLLTQYSSTQRPIIATYLQAYLLNEKIRNGEDGLRLMWIECPIDRKTRDMLTQFQKMHDITIIVGVTGDFTQENLNPGEFIIENGFLLTDKIK